MNSINSRHRCDVVSRESVALAVLIAGILFAGSVHAQLLQPVANDDQSNVHDEIQAVYTLTKTASSFADYKQISKRCEEILAAEIGDKDARYLNSLIAWAKNRQAEKHLQNGNGLREIGLIEQANEQFEFAIKKYDDIIQTQPLAWRGWMGRAVIHAESGEYRNALDKFRQVVKLDSKNTNARFNCAELALHLKEYKDAIADYSKLISDDPTDVQALTGRGHCFAALKKFDEALDDYQTVVKLHPENAVALGNLGNAYHSAGEAELGDKILARARELTGTSARKAAFPGDSKKR